MVYSISITRAGVAQTRVIQLEIGPAPHAELVRCVRAAHVWAVKTWLHAWRTLKDTCSHDSTSLALRPYSTQKPFSQAATRIDFRLQHKCTSSWSCAPGRDCYLHCPVSPTFAQTHDCLAWIRPYPAKKQRQARSGSRVIITDSS